MSLMADVEMVPITIYLLHIPLMIWIAAEASRRFSEDRSNNTFEALLSTPLSARQIIQGQWLALFKQFAAPIALVLVWEAFIVIFRSNQRTQFLYPVSGIWPGMLLLVTDAVALAWAGMWLGLKSKGRVRAILGSLILVLFVPWLMAQMIDGMFLRLMVRVLARTVIPRILWEENGRLFAALVPSLLLDLLIIGLAASRLPRAFRQLAIRR